MHFPFLCRCRGCRYGVVASTLFRRTRDGVWTNRAARAGVFRHGRSIRREPVGARPGMSARAVLERLRVPVVGAPMFLVSGPDLVIEQCKGGIVGSFPALNARPQELFDEWLTQIETALDKHRRDNPSAIVAPY